MIQTLQQWDVKGMGVHIMKGFANWENAANQSGTDRKLLTEHDVLLL